MNDTQNSSKKQKRNFITLIIFALVVLMVLFYLIGGDNSHHSDRPVEKSTINQSIDSVEAEELWREESANKLAHQAEENKALKAQIDVLSNQFKTLKNQEVSSSNEKIDYLIKELAEVKQKMAVSANAMDGNPPAQYMQPNTEKPNDFPQTAIHRSSPQSGIFSYQLKLNAPKEEAYNDKTINNYLPIGAFGRATILGGIDASTSLSSQSDPRPVLMRLIDYGRLPKNVRSKIKDCHVIGAGYGDISSERVYVRLETISCTTNSGEIFEKPVHGYVAGADGKDGIRGKVVWREGPLVQRAFIAGTLSQIGQGISDTYTTTSVSPLGVVESVDTSDIFQAGIAQGSSSALDRLAEYNIQRAEAYQPIIEVNAGQIVEIVINHEGLYLRNPTLEEAKWNH